MIRESTHVKPVITYRMKSVLKRISKTSSSVNIPSGREALGVRKKSNKKLKIKNKHRIEIFNRINQLFLRVHADAAGERSNVAVDLSIRYYVWN